MSSRLLETVSGEFAGPQATAISEISMAPLVFHLTGEGNSSFFSRTLGSSAHHARPAKGAHRRIAQSTSDPSCWNRFRILSIVALGTNDSCSVSSGVRWSALLLSAFVRHRRGLAKFFRQAA